MLLILILIKCATSQVQTGWHASIHRVDVNRCNAIKSKMQQYWFCGSRNLECEKKEGFEILGRDAQFIHQSTIPASVELHGEWIDQLRDFDPDITELQPSQCDILRLSAIIGTPWANIDRVDTPHRGVTKLSIWVGPHRHRFIVGQDPGRTWPKLQGRSMITIQWEVMTQLYFVIDGTTIDLSIEVNDPWNFFSPDKMGFHHSRQAERRSVNEGKVIVASEPFFFSESLTHGTVLSVSAKCTDDIRGGTMLLEEVLIPGEPGRWVASCRNGYRSTKFSMRKATSKMSAIAVCQQGMETVEVYSEKLVDYPTAVALCKVRQMDIPSLDQIRSTSFCDKIYPFGDYYYMWIRHSDSTEEPVEYETVEDIFPHAETFEDDVDQDSLIVDINAWTTAVIPGTGPQKVSDDFPQLMNSDRRWGIVAEYTYPKECHVLETKVEYRPLGIDFETIEGVSRWIVSRRNGLWIYGEFMMDVVDLQAEFRRSGGTLRAASLLMRSENNPVNLRTETASTHVKFVGFGEINHISGNTLVHPGGVPRTLHYNGDSRAPNAFSLQRSFLAVKTVSQCVISVVSTSRYKLNIFGNGVNYIKYGTDNPFVTSQQHKDHVTTSFINAQELTFVPGRFYYVELMTYQLRIQDPNSVVQLSLLWNCGSGPQVVPRLNLFSVGNTDDQIISDKVHINVGRSAEFRLTLTAPPSTTVEVVCTGPSSVVITPSVFSFDALDWSVMKTVTVFSGLSHSNHQNNPDALIQCTSAGLKPLSVSVTVEANEPHHFQVSPSGYVAHWFSAEQQWRVRDFQLAALDGENECVWTLLDFHDSKFSFYIETQHSKTVAEDITFSPLTGVAFAYGPYVFAAYTSVLSRSNGNGWDIYRLSEPQPGGPKISRVPLENKFNPGKLTVEFPCGSSCEVIPHGHNFMHLSCVISSSYAQGWQVPSDDWCLPQTRSFFQYPSATTDRPTLNEAVPAWPAGSTYNNHIFTSVSPPALLQRTSLVFLPREKMSLDEFSAFTEWSASLENGVDFAAPGVWNGRNGIQSKCPLMSDKIVSALRPLISRQVANLVPEINLPEFITSILKRCQADSFMSLTHSCLGPYQFNDDDAVQSLRSMVFYFVSMARKVSDNIAMVGRGLTVLADNGMPGHLCARSGHLVGFPPQCACIGSGVYPNCVDTIDCPPSTQEQLDTMGSLAVPNLGTEFCSAEKSIVIVRSLGVSINCFRGFCYYWSSPSVRNGLKYEMCVTPYCVTGYQQPDADTITWYGLTECGETVVSHNNGDTWSVSAPFPANAPEEMKGTPVASQMVRIPLTDSEYYEVSSSNIVRAGHSSGKMVTVSMKWWCECIDPDTWNILF